jgi:hypothetical protein
MNYRHLVAGTILATAAFSASALDRNVTVELDEACPAGTAQGVPTYSWEGGRFVRDGWVCETLYRGGGGN